MLKHGIIAALFALALAIVGAGAGAGAAGTAGAETFEDVTFLALNKDPRVGAAIAAAQGEEARVRQIIATGRPQISNTIYAEGDGTNDAATSIARIELSQELYSFGRQATSIEAAEQRVVLGWIEVARTNQDVFADASIAYANLLESDELRAVRQGFLADLSARQATILERIDAGLAGIIEYQALARRLAEAEINVLLAEQEATSARLEMERLSGSYVQRTRGNGLDLYLNLTPQSLNQSKFLAQNNAPESHVSAQRYRIVEADVAAQNRASNPSIEAYGTQDYGISNGVDLDDRQVGIRLSVPVFQGGLRGAVRAQGAASVQGALRLRQQDELFIAQAAADAWLSLDIATRAAAVWHRTLRIQRDQERAVQNEVDADLATLDDLLDVQGAIVETQVEHIRAHYNIIRAQLVLLRTVGLSSPLARE